MSYHAIKEWITIAEQKNLPLWEVVLEDDMSERAVSREDSLKEMEKIWDAMLLSAEQYDGTLRSNSCLVGTDGQKLEDYGKKGNTLCGDFINKVMTRAVQVSESNACMKRIVAAPTAGSCGVMPAVFVTLYKEQKATKEQIIQALYVASGIGKVVAERASIAGASGGCQAEVGTASAMTAGALAALHGCTSKQIGDALAIALKNLLGLACDPVAGLVEVPCVKRNVIGAVNAVAAADMVLAGIESVIPPDDVIDAMGEIGYEMSYKIKETALGGLAATPTGQAIADRVLQK